MPRTSASPGTEVGERFMRRLLAVVAAAALTIATMGIATPAPVSAGTPFTDISDSQFIGNINWAYDNGITAGCDTDRFCPKATVTRDQMASFLVRMFNLPSTTQDYFTDDEANIHEGSINRLAASGITGGCAANKYCPKAGVTREQMASFIARAADLAHVSSNPFYDDDFRPHEGDINRIAAEGIGSGCNDYRFCPANFVNREQMVAFLNRVVDPVTPVPQQAPCDRSYTPFLCIPSPPPQLTCNDVGYDNFFVRQPDPHVFDGNNNGFGCET